MIGSNGSPEAEVTFSRPEAEAEHDSGVGTADDMERCSLTGSSSGDLDEDTVLLDPVIDPPEIFLDRPSSRKYTSISPRDSSCSDSGRSSEFHLSDSDSSGEESTVTINTAVATQITNSAVDR